MHKTCMLAIFSLFCFLFLLVLSCFTCVRSSVAYIKMDVVEMQAADCLSTKDLRLVFGELFVARVKWYNIGLELEINPSDLDAVGVKNKEDPEKCFKESLSIWLNKLNPTPTWNIIVNALKSPVVGYEQLSESVKKKHSTSSSATLVHMKGHQPKSQHQKKIESGNFQCPCGKCDLLTYLNKSCPKSSTSSYPYLPLSEISENDREDLIQKLSEDTANIIQRFADLLSNTGKSLNKRQITVSELVKVSLDLGVYKSARNPVPLLLGDQKKLEEATSIEYVFNILRKHMSFFNYEILVHIISHLGDDDDRKNFEVYSHHFKLYCQRKVFEVCPKACEASGDKRTKFVVVGTQDFFASLADVKAAQRKIASLLDLRSSTVQLTQIDMGCVILIFSIPKMLNDLFPLKPSTLANLKACGYTLFIPSTSDYSACRLNQAPDTEHQSLQSVEPQERITESVVSSKEGSKECSTLPKPTVDGQQADTFETELMAFLVDNQVKVDEFEKFVGSLKEMGAISMNDLVELTENDLENTDMKLLQRRKFMRAITKRFPSVTSVQPKSKIPAIDQLSRSSSISSADTTFDVEHEIFTSELEDSLILSPTTDLSTRIQDKISIHYIHCSGIFVDSMEKRTIPRLKPSVATLNEVYAIIATEQKLPKDMILEMYFCEGYPLDVNNHSLKATLSTWGISDGCLLYTFVRPQKQPGLKLKCDVRNPFKKRTRESGQHCLEVRSQLHGTFSISVDAEVDDVEVIKEKVYSITNIPPVLFDLKNECGESVRNVQDSCKLQMFPKKLYELYDGSYERPFGACTYQQSVEQTQAGKAKFYSYLLYMMKQLETDLKRTLVVYIDTEYGCPPLTYALLCLFEVKVLKQLGCWVALVEGLFQLFTAILSTYFEVPQNRVFEFSDYLWGWIIIQAEKIPSSYLAKYNSDSVQLTCPISSKRMIEPVNLPKSQTTYEKVNLLKKIARKEGVGRFSFLDLAEENFTPDELMQRLLMCNLFQTSDSVITWTNPSRFFKINRIEQVSLPSNFILERFTKCNQMIPTYKPSAIPNLTGVNATHLTTYEKGFAAVSLGKTKSDDGQTFQFYNPLYDPKSNKGFFFINAQEMSQLPVGVKVSMINFLNAKVKGVINPEDIDKVTVSPPTGNTTLNVFHRFWRSLTSSLSLSTYQDTSRNDFTREAFEAIIVTLDISESMREHIFSEKGMDYSRIRAAKDLFDAFVNRTQAYDLHHVIGLITFESKVEVKLEVTENLTLLNHVLKSVQPCGRTALYDATIKACDLLNILSKLFPNCKRRILCLTDGEDNCSRNVPEDVLSKLRNNNVVMDTVLIRGTASNAVQKAITFASGGYCFNPKTMVEATAIFEIEQLVTIRARPEQTISAGSLNHFKTFDYTSSEARGNEQFQHKEKKIVDQATFTTPKRVLEHFLLLGFDESASPSAASSSRIRRVMKELTQYQQNPHSAVDVFPSENNVTLWKMILEGPVQTPYENGVFLLYMKFPDKYPSQSPQIRFITPIYHCNINSSGRVCHSSLDSHYVPTMTTKKIISYIYGLLMDPEPADPLDSVLALELRENRAQYEAKARELTRRFAGIDRFEVRKSIVGQDDTISSKYICPLTKKLFVDPVTTQSGHTYEKAAILEYFRTHGNMDPISKIPVSSELFPNLSIKDAAEELRRAQRSLK